MTSTSTGTTISLATTTLIAATGRRISRLVAEIAEMVATGAVATGRPRSRPEDVAATPATNGNTTRNTGAALPIRTAQPPTGLAVRPAESPSPTVKQVRGSKSAAREGTCAARETAARG